MAKKAIKGKFPYKDGDKVSKKAKRKKMLEELRKKDKRLRMQCECNHIDSKHGKTHFKKSDDGIHKFCKICGGQIISDGDMMTLDAINGAVDIIYSLFAKVRNTFNLDEKTDLSITNALQIIMRSPELYEQIVDIYNSKNGKKKKNKKNKKNKGKKYTRIQY